MFKSENFIEVGAINPNFIVKTVRYWDKAGTKEDKKKKNPGQARTAGVRMHLM